MIWVFILSALLVSALDVVLSKNETWPKKVYLFLFDFFYGLSSSLFIARFLFNIRKLFYIRLVSTRATVKAIVLTVVMTIVFIAIRRFVNHLVAQKEKNSFGPTDWTLRIVLSLIFLLGSVLFIGSAWFISFFGKLTPEQFLFNFNSPVTGTADSMSQTIIDTPVLLAVVANLGCLPLIWMPRFFNKFSRRILTTLVSLITLSVFLGACTYAVKEMQLIQVYHAYFDDSPYVEDNYVNPKEALLAFPTKKRNLIHLYLESYENSYFDKESGGFMDQDLMPDLKELSKEGIHFSETDRFGGPFQTYGSSWSVASMINMNVGLPLKIPMDGNSYGKTGQFLPGATTLGDILNDEGYEQTVMFGADADFGGLTAFFSTHGNFNIFDLKYARKEGLIPEDYKVWWGFEDKKLYGYAKNELTRLAATGKPFHFAMENADTHFPNGYLEPGTPTPYESHYANVILHSQAEIVELVRWIQEQPFYENTTIVLTGDHLSMDKKFFKSFDESYHRTTFNLILNSAFETNAIQTTNRLYAPFDYFPTILSSLGVKIPNHRLGLGTDLSSNEKTLLERDGVDQFNEQLSRNSQFYNHAFVSEKGHQK